MNRAIENNDRFLVEPNGEPAVIILSVADYVKTFAPPPDWLQKSWQSAKRHGLDKLTTKEIDAESAVSARSNLNVADDPGRYRRENSDFRFAPTGVVSKSMNEDSSA